MSWHWGCSALSQRKFVKSLVISVVALGLPGAVRKKIRQVVSHQGRGAGAAQRRHKGNSSRHESLVSWRWGCPALSRRKFVSSLIIIVVGLILLGLPSSVNRIVINYKRHSAGAAQRCRNCEWHGNSSR